MSVQPMSQRSERTNVAGPRRDGRFVVLSGAGRTADPWHPFASTSEALASIARAEGLEGAVVEGPLEGLADLSEDVRLIILNAGDPHTALPLGADDPGEPDAQLVNAAALKLRDAVDRGIGLLGVHAAASTLRELPGFGDLIGARWERGRSWHPPIGHLEVSVDEHGGFLRRGAFEVYDELYMELDISGDATPRAIANGSAHRGPVLWTRVHERSRIAYSALGHDERAYRSVGHRELLAATIQWVIS